MKGCICISFPEALEKYKGLSRWVASVVYHACMHSREEGISSEISSSNMGGRGRGDVHEGEGKVPKGNPKGRKILEPAHK